uniref:Secreted protein n=1 Tax=Glossina palpalis gambiensis TaxID=67801 RepID=A0A1B0BAM0_9MUSC
MSAQSQVQCLLVGSTIISLLTLANTFCYAPQPQIVIRAPQLKFFKPQMRSSYFGYNIVMRPTSLSFVPVARFITVCNLLYDYLD